jgi:hypothetical protein
MVASLMTASSPSAVSGAELDLAAVRDWVSRSGQTDQAIAVAANVDEKTVRNVARSDWNPRVETLRKLMRAMPCGWRAGDPVPERDERAAGAPAANAAASGDCL